MVKRRAAPETIEEVEEVIMSIDSEPSTTQKTDEKTVDEDGMIREELIKLSDRGEIPQSVALIKKASKKVLMRINAEYEKRKLDEANHFLADLVVSKFSDILATIDAIGNPNELTAELSNDKLLKRDVLRVMELITPYVPFLGLLSGGAITAKHVYDHKSKITEITVTNPAYNPQ